MIVYIGADHGGFELKNKLKKIIEKKGFKVVDKGNLKLDPDDDFPDFAAAVAKEVSKNPRNRGILICRSGAGMDIVANKFRGVLGILGMNSEQVKWSRNDDNVNVLVIPGEYLSMPKILGITESFLKTSYSPNLRFERRLKKIAKIEKQNFK